MLIEDFRYPYLFRYCHLFSFLLCCAARYNIPELLKNGPMSAAQIAAELGKAILLAVTHQIWLQLDCV